MKLDRIYLFDLTAPVPPITTTTTTAPPTTTTTAPHAITTTTGSVIEPGAPSDNEDDNNNPDVPMPGDNDADLPDTGYNGKLKLLGALLFLAGGAVTVIAVDGRKKRE
ncbi:MAG: hypothetical protein GX851_06910 [Clostridiales bacterium]|nr:hypothetical protein [Clostridiales bacterium]